jgi:putative hydrolase of the HAD superfamily
LDDTLFDRRATQAAVLELVIAEFPDLFSAIERRLIVNALIMSDSAAIARFDDGAMEDEVRAVHSREFLRLLGLPLEREQDITRFYVHHYPLVGRAFPGAQRLLESLDGIYRLGVISNGFAEMQRRKLSSLGWESTFEATAFSSEIGVRKPDPVIFYHLAGQLAVKPDLCLVVGNSHKDDIMGAHAAGMASCWFNPDGTRLMPRQRRPDLEIGSLSTLNRVLVGSHRGRRTG